MTSKKSSNQFTLNFSDQKSASKRECRVIPFVDAATQRAREDAVRRVAAAGIFPVHHSIK